MSYHLTGAERQWTPDEEYEERLRKEEFDRKQRELAKKIKKHIEESDASEDLVNPEFL